LVFFRRKESQRSNDLPFEPFLRPLTINAPGISRVSTNKDDDVNEIIVKIEMKKFQKLI